MRGQVKMSISGDALMSNWRTMAALSGSARCAAVVKADGYGLGAREVVARLADAGCRQFFVARWVEARALMPWPSELALGVFHGVAPDEVAEARASPAMPVLVSVEQVARWRAAGGGACMAMVDTGINRLGLAAAQVTQGALDGLDIRCLLSHLTSGEIEDDPMNARQLALFKAVSERLPGVPRSLANSAGIALGADYHFDITRPGIALYGGYSHPRLDERLRPVVTLSTRVLQRRRLETGEGIGYNHRYVARAPTEIALIDCGYADGFGRHFSNRGRARSGDAYLPVAGLVSMDMTAVVVDAAPQLREGDPIEIDFDLIGMARALDCPPNELLTTIAPHCRKQWD